MGGFFIRKLAGAACVGVQLQKLLPLLVHLGGVHWGKGHFRPLLISSVVGNLLTIIFYGLQYSNMEAADAGLFAIIMASILAIETVGLLLFVLTSPPVTEKNMASAMPPGKTPNSFVSNIVSRTVAFVSGLMTIVALRDLFAPGYILPFIPYDDIFLEWTNAFIHSPPEGSPEESQHGLQAALYIGDRFASQWLALQVFILCIHKFASAFGVRYKANGEGQAKCRLMWRPQAVSDAMLLLVFRLFQPAAVSASCDLRWHLMLIAYEGFILGK